MPGDEAMQIARTIVHRVNEIRLHQALEEAHRARLAFLREDLFDGDCARCIRRVRDAEDRAASLVAALAGRPDPADALGH